MMISFGVTRSLVRRFSNKGKSRKQVDHRRIGKVRVTMMDPGNAQSMAFDERRPGALSLEAIFQALSDPVRLGIVVQLHRQGESTCAALDGGRPKSTMSHHFRVLREAGLVRTRIQGVTHMNTLCRDSLEVAFPGLLSVILAAAKD